MKIFLITDIHHGEDTNYPNLKGVDYTNLFGGQFKDIIPSLYPIMDTCDLVVNLGDFIHDESAEKDLDMFREAKALLEGTQTPVKHVIGNHDCHHIPRETLCRLIAEKETFYSFDLSGFHHIILEGVRREPRGPHFIPEAQLKWLEADLVATTLPTVIYTHIPVDLQDMSQNYYFKNAPERAFIGNMSSVRRVFEKSEKVIAVFSGHTHYYGTQEINGIRYVTIPSFSENDTEHRPNRQYAIATTEERNVSVTISKAGNTSEI